jgi:hypothetical protein
MFRGCSRITEKFLAVLLAVFFAQLVQLPTHDLQHFDGASRQQEHSPEKGKAARECGCDLCGSMRAADPASLALAPHCKPESAFVILRLEDERCAASGFVFRAPARAPPGFSA